MPSREHRQVNPGHILIQATLGVAALGVAGWGTTLSLRSMYPSTATSAAVSAATSTLQQRPGGEGSAESNNENQLANSVAVMSAIGFSPDLLAVIGVTSGELAALMAQANETAATDVGTLQTQNAAVSTATRSLAAKERELRLASDDTARSTIRAQIATLRDQLASARSQLATTTAGLRSTYRGWLQSDEQSRLDTIDTKPGMQVPLYYAVVARTEADWVKLRDALSAQKHATRKSITLNTQIAEYLETIDADQAVQAAKTRWEANAATLRAMWH